MNEQKLKEQEQYLYDEGNRSPRWERSEVPPRSRSWVEQIETEALFSDGDSVEEPSRFELSIEVGNWTEVVEGKKRFSVWLRGRRQYLAGLNDRVADGQPGPEIMADGYVRMWMLYYRLAYDPSHGRFTGALPRQRKRV